MKTCVLCNETIEQDELDYGDACLVDDEFWHTECYAEYFGESLEESLEVA